MAYAQTKTIAVEKIPVIDASPLSFGTSEAAQAVALKIRQAAEEVGFFYICNHGISEAIIKQAYRAAQGFFSRPKKWKDSVKINSNHHGFLSVGESKMDRSVVIEAILKVWLFGFWRLFRLKR